MSPLGLALLVAAMFFMAYLDAGRQNESTLRCVACGTRVGEKHHSDCHYRDRL